MPDDKSSRGSRDGALVASRQAYEVSYFARKHGIAAVEARRILRRAGASRAKATSLGKNALGLRRRQAI